MKRILVTGLLMTTTFFVFAQDIDAIINAKEVERIERKLASDEMRGRRVFTPDIDRAADFIADEFKKIGLQTWGNSGSYMQEFAMVRPKFTGISATIDGIAMDEKNVVVFTCKEKISINKQSGYEIVSLAAGVNLNREVNKLIRTGKNLIVLVNSSHAANFSRLTGLKRNVFKFENQVVCILTDTEPGSFEIKAKHEITEQRLANVVAVLPGKSRKEEYVIFSGHYDHLGVTSKPASDDSIYNGANDNAAGTTAVIMLAKYFKALNNNERTLVFTAFTAEETGGYGSQYFSQQFADPGKIIAMSNIEMIGTDSKWGKNSAYITGYEKTDMGSIMQKNLEGTLFTFYPDPYPEQNLFYRSDNATLARLGVPAHTISTAKMDGEPNYHKVSDHIETLDMENMAMIIKSIALSSKTIVAAKETPTRVKVEGLR